MRKQATAETINDRISKKELAILDEHFKNPETKDDLYEIMKLGENYVEIEAGIRKKKSKLDK